MSFQDRNRRNTWFEEKYIGIKKIIQRKYTLFDN